MQLTFASYNIHKGVGLDRRRDPDRILNVLREIDADVIALQEADRRFGERASVLPRQAIDEHSPWKIVPIGMRPLSMGWHGNALLVRRSIEVVAARAVPLPMLEPRGAICADLRVEGRALRVVGMHLDLSGLRRRHQVEAVCGHLGDCAQRQPAVLMGDLNEWSQQAGALRAFGEGYRVLAPGRSFPARRPLAQLDRIVVTPEWDVEASGVHHSTLSAVGSDHLPVWAKLRLPA
jgi:endonuclease/exonuclease/phosphatase family metal-dependent hydrolase